MRRVNVPVTSGSALPAWLSEILPKWFLSRPIFTEALWAGCYSAYLALTTCVLPMVVLDMWADGAFSSQTALVTWLKSKWFLTIVGIVIAPYVRARQALGKATAATKGTP